MKARIYTNVEQIYDLADGWNDLLLNSEANNLFLTWEWIFSWLKVNETKIKPFVVIVRDSKQKIIGIAPFHLKNRKVLFFINFRILHIMADFATGSEYPDIIVDKENEESICKIIGKALKDYHRKWDCIWLPHIASWHGAEQRIRMVCEYAGAKYRRRKAVFSTIQLPKKIDRLLESCSRNRRSQLNRQKKKILKQENISFVNCTDNLQVEYYLDNLFKLHKKRWNRKGEKGTFVKKPEEADFYRIFAPLALRKKWLWLYGVKNNDEFKAIQIGYVYNNTFYQLQEGFDPEFTEGVGNVLRLQVIEKCIFEGIRNYDFLYGFTEHKRRWMAKIREGADILILNKHLKNKIIELGAIWPTGRFMKRSCN